MRLIAVSSRYSDTFVTATKAALWNYNRCVMFFFCAEVGRRKKYVRRTRKDECLSPSGDHTTGDTHTTTSRLLVGELVF
jgi:hypothetical protein